jgi:hypothetical protein
MNETKRTDLDVGAAFLAEGRRKLAACHQRIRHCVQQLTDAQVWWRPSEGHNSIANLLLHLCGNVRQWVVAGVSGMPDSRNRPQEFAERGPSAGKNSCGGWRKWWPRPIQFWAG